MSSDKHKLHNTELDNLISNLRGEVGDILLTWKLYVRLNRNVRRLYTSDIDKDLSDPNISLLEIIIDKLEDEIVSRLSELAEIEIGRLTFHFAQQKLKDKADLSPMVFEYKNFIEQEKFKAKRNQFISHKQLPEKWTDYEQILVSVRTIGKAVALVVKLMITIDKVFLGPSAIYLWREVLKKKTAPMRPLHVNFLLLPYMNLDQATREIIIKKEVKAGLPVWETAKAKIDGVERDVIVCKKWGALLINPHRILIFDKYPLLELSAIDFVMSKEETGT